MAGKKKKKAVANPARGFATVSIPSKPKDAADDLAVSSREEKDLPAVIAETQLKRSDVTGSGSHETDIAKMTPEQLEVHLEKEELSLFVDKHVAAVKSLAARYASRSQNERRQMRAQADKAVVSGAMNELLEDVLKIQPVPDWKRPDNTLSFCVDEIEILLKLWTLQEVLIRLQMPSINDALTYVLSRRFRSQKDTVDQVSGLTEVYEWYAAKFASNELPSYENAGRIAIADQVESEDEKVLSDKTPTPDQDQHIEHKAATEFLDEIPSEFELSQDEDSDDDDNPSVLVERWLGLQTLNLKIDQYRGAKHYELQKRKINENLDKINRDLLFDGDLAEQRWNVIRRDLDIQTAQAKKKTKKNVEDTTQQPVQTAMNTVTDDAESDLMLGDMFEDQQLSLMEGHAANATVRIKDFGQHSGSNPRRILEDLCSKSPVMERVKIVPLHVTSYSARVKLMLFWKQAIDLQDDVRLCLPQGVRFESQSRTWSLSMETLATVNSSQAEAFMSTLALFVLDSEGHNANKSATLLPKLWKEKYMDFKEDLQEARRKKDVENVSFLREMIRNTHTNIDPIKPASTTNGKASRNQRDVATENVSSQEKLPVAIAIELWQTRARRPAYQKMQALRTSLPVFAYKETILQTSEQNQIILVCADTGAGKSTQIPSYVLEHGLTQGNDLRILVTQPRRISAISIARRVSEEMGEDGDHLGTSRSLVGYAIRLESKISASTRLTFATTGVLLRMLQDSFNLDQYNCLILDEVHERTMDLDLIFIALKQLQMRRTDLKIILMSATVETNKFSAYFDNCPVLQIPGRTFPVQIGFLEDAIQNTLGLQEKVEEFQDTEEPPAGSDDEEEELDNKYALSATQYSSATLKSLEVYDHKRIDYQLILRLAAAIATYPRYKPYSTALLIFMPGLAEIRRLNNILTAAKTFSTNWVIHMLHSSFSTRELEQAFLRPPPGVRKIVIATNIAETGITIPDVTAVIDTCKEKVMRFDERRQLSRLTEGLISQSSARQRRGRAARVQNGLCFHLIPKYYYDHKLPEQSTPEMLRLSLQQSLLRIKVWNLGSIEDVLSAAIDPPTSKNTHRAIAKLRDAGAIDSVERLTSLGKLLAKLPLDVALGKLAIYGVLFQSLDAAVTIIAIISVKSIFTESRTPRDYSQTSFFSHDSELMTTYNIYCGWKNACKGGIGQQFCRNQHLSYAQLLQVDEQKIQLLVYLCDAGLLLLNHQEKSALNRARTSRRVGVEFEIPTRYNRLNDEDVVAAVIAVAFHPRILRRESGSTYRNVYTNQYLQVASLPKEKVAGFRTPKWLCYMETIQVKGGKVNVLNSSRITEPLMVALLGDAEFNLFAGVVTIDNGNIRISLRQWREVLAFKRLRQLSRKFIDGFLSDPSTIISSDYVNWSDLLVKILRKVNPVQ